MLTRFTVIAHRELKSANASVLVMIERPAKTLPPLQLNVFFAIVVFSIMRYAYHYGTVGPLLMLDKFGSIVRRG